VIKTETTSGWGGVRAGAGGKPKPRIAPNAPYDLHWYCIRTAYAPEWWAERAARLLLFPPPAYEREPAAAEAIRSAGFEVFAPTIFKPATRRRRNVVGAMIPARPAGERPLFGNYIFARFARHGYWQQLRDMECVDTILGLAPDAPTPLPDRAIELIRGMCDANGCFHERGEVPNSLVGTLMRVTDGSFTSFEGICDWSDGQRVRLMLAMFGRPCPTVFDQTMVEAA
jgi:transcription antitermination factor NusG